MFKRILLCCFVFLSLSATLSGCGIKPGSVEPPPGAEDRVFPRTYPDPSTDPTP